MNKRTLSLICSLLATATVLMACQTTVVGPIPTTPPTTTPCAQSCGPVYGSPAGSTVVRTSAFDLSYYAPPWKMESHDTTSVVLSYSTDFGDVILSLDSTTVPDGTTGDALLAAWLKQNIDPNKFQGINDYGVIHGAEIGYVAGAGKAIKANLVLPNAPSAPIFLQVMAATKGTTGLILAVVSPLDPNSPDPTDRHQVRKALYDLIANSVRWL